MNTALFVVLLYISLKVPCETGSERYVLLIKKNKNVVDCSLLTFKLALSVYQLLTEKFISRQHGLIISGLILLKSKIYPILIKHFQTRFNDTSWLIADIKNLQQEVCES